MEALGGVGRALSRISMKGVGLLTGSTAATEVGVALGDKNTSHVLLGNA